MLVLTIKQDGRVKVGPNIWVQVVRIEPGQVGLAFEAPREVVILREKLVDRDARRQGDGQGGGR